MALVSGGSGGIGRACATALAERGYDLVLTARSEERLRAVAQELGARYVAADGTDPDQVARVVETAGALDMVVHAAGVLEGTFVSAQPVEVFERVMEVNLGSAYILSRAALPRMVAGSRIVYISSTAGHQGMKGLTAYSASKGGLRAMAQAFALEVQRDGIGVHLVTPDPVRTDMIDPHSGLEMWLLEPEDVASAVVWLDSLHPRVVVEEVVLRCARKGPFAPPSVGLRA